MQAKAYNYCQLPSSATLDQTPSSIIKHLVLALLFIIHIIHYF